MVKPFLYGSKLSLKYCLATNHWSSWFFGFRAIMSPLFGEPFCKSTSLTLIDFRLCVLVTINLPSSISSFVTGRISAICVLRYCLNINFRISLLIGCVVFASLKVQIRVNELSFGQVIALLFRFFSQGIALRLLHITPKRFTKFIGLAGRSVNYLVCDDAQFFVNAIT